MFIFRDFLSFKIAKTKKSTIAHHNQAPRENMWWLQSSKQTGQNSRNIQNMLAYFAKICCPGHVPSSFLTSIRTIWKTVQVIKKGNCKSATYFAKSLTNHTFSVCSKYIKASEKRKKQKPIVEKQYMRIKSYAPYLTLIEPCILDCAIQLAELLVSVTHIPVP